MAKRRRGRNEQPASSRVKSGGWPLNRVEPGIWVERQCDLILRHEPACWFGEKGAIEKAVKPYLTYRMSERRAYCRLE